MAAACLKQYNVRCHPRAASPIAHCCRLLIVWCNSKMQPVVSLPALHSSDAWTFLFNVYANTGPLGLNLDQKAPHNGPR